MTKVKPPVFSTEEVILLILVCEGLELVYLRSIIYDDFNLGRINPEDFGHMWTLIDRKLAYGRPF
jgi:hypothetical protein